MKSINALSSATLAVCLAIESGIALADVDSYGNRYGQWRLCGFGRTNDHDSSSIGRVTKYNVDKLQIKWIYTIAPVPATAAGTSGVGSNPIDNPRDSTGAATGPIVDRKGRVYIPTFDGRIIVLDSKRTSTVDGFASPNLLMTMDLFADPKYILPGQIPGLNLYHTRNPPSFVNNALYVGNYNFFNARAGGFGDGSLYAQKAVGTPTPDNPNYVSGGSVLYKIDRRTGNLIWKTQLDNNPNNHTSPMGVTPVKNTLNGDIVIAGTGSEISGTVAIYPISTSTPDPFGGHCCDYRGAVVAVRQTDGKVMWKTYLAPKQDFPTLNEAIATGTVDAWTGGTPSWGAGHAPYSKVNKMLYFGTSEYYTATTAANTCEANRLAAGGPVVDTTNQCLKYVQGSSTPSTASFNSNFVESTYPYRVNSPVLPLPDAVVALDVNTGQIKWAKPVGGFDVWTAACFAPFVPSFLTNFVPFCPDYLRSNLFIQFDYKDRDMSASPILVENVKMTADGLYHDVVLAAGKAAAIFAFDAKTGQSLWTQSDFGLGGLNGDGLTYAMASDGKRLFGTTGTSNNLFLSDLTAPGNPKKVVLDGSCLPQGFDATTGKWRGGLYIAVDIASGQIAWQRCVIAQALPANRISTPKPTADCISGVAPAAICGASGAQGGLSVSNGVVVATGGSNYDPAASLLGVPPPPVPGELVLLDAETGALLRELPLNLPNQASANIIIYQTPIIVGKRIFATTGVHSPDNGLPTPVSPYNRAVMWELSNDIYDTDDDLDDNGIQEGENE